MTEISHSTGKGKTMIMTHEGKKYMVPILNYFRGFDLVKSFSEDTMFELQY